MGIFYDNNDFKKRYFNCDPKPYDTPKKSYLKHFFPTLTSVKYINNIDNSKPFDEIILVNQAPKSQYDTLIKLTQNKNLNEQLLCLAGEGKNFHGFKNRKWNSFQGNIHLSANFKPNQQLQNFTLGFLILSAISVVQTIDEIDQLKNKAQIKWVNDIIIDDKKIAGVLAHCLTQDKIINDAIIGIGLNVNVNPNTEPTKFVPQSACLNDFLTNKNQVNEKFVFQNLLKHLSQNYQKLLNNGYYDLLNIYKKRSIVLDKNVSIWTDEIDDQPKLICKGKVIDIGNNLELQIQGYDKKIINGRLALEDKI